MGIPRIVLTGPRPGAAAGKISAEETQETRTAASRRQTQETMFRVELGCSCCCSTEDLLAAVAVLETAREEIEIDVPAENDSL